MKYLNFICTIFCCILYGVLSKSVTDKKCHLLEIPLQKDFDISRFEGLWYASHKTGIKDSILSYFTEIYDGRIHFKSNIAGGFDLKAAGSKFYGGWCPKGKGNAAVKDEKAPEKMTMYFDTSIGRKIGMKPAWVLKTDYKNYAVFYSCWKELQNGKCDSDKTYAFVTTRSTKPLSKQKLGEVEQALASACVDISDLTPVKHYGYCQEKDGL
ncbi:retinol-binding protein 4-like [Mya arenaria]|uniref:retinol-binding protein 4-like n=1 Tax=Mya arenaria TaxID=6604 RepID=UPI0022E7C265|nr:retinol-binding protein 4-like [Mya arenaria]